MPTCCIKHCTSRTSDKTKNLKFFGFPKEDVIRQQWLDACKRKETDIKVDTAMICSNHFDADCFIMEWTQPRLKNVPAKEMKRLRKNSIPTKMLIPEKEEEKKKRGRKRKRMPENGETKVPIRTGIPTYTDLVKCVQERQHFSHKEIVQNMEAEAAQNVDNTNNIEEINSITKKSVQHMELENDTTNVEIDKKVDNHTNVSMRNAMDTLLVHLQESEEKNRKLLKEDILKQENEQLRMEVTKLQTGVTHLEAEVTKMTTDREKQTDVISVEVLRKVFTPGQIARLKSSTNSRIRWSPEVSAIGLRSLSPKAYRYLRNVQKIPLPCASTLKNWVSKFNLLPGILNDVLKIMSSKGDDLSITEKLTLLTFDELYVSNQLQIERKQQKVYGSHKTCQFIMSRGLFKNWRQPVFYNFDTAMTREILFSIIQHLYDIGYIVIAITCDMGSTNMRLWKELQIGTDNNNSTDKSSTNTEKKCFIVHPCNDALKIFFYADIPRLIKLARNNLLDFGFNTNGISVNKTCLEELLKLNERDLKIAHKLNRTHIDVKGTQRQKVKLAAQMFSNQNASAIRWCGENGLISSTNWKYTSNVLELFNDWFDIFNSLLKYGKCNSSHAYGIDLERQNEIIINMDKFIEEMRVGQRKSMMQFQKGILLCNKSLREMFVYIQHKYSSEEFDVKYILTRRLNQDILEKFFSYIRSMGSAYDHPAPVEVKNRLKLYILGKHSEHVVS